MQIRWSYILMTFISLKNVRSSLKTTFLFWLPTFMTKLPILFFFSTCLILSTDSKCNDYRPTCPVRPVGQDKCYYDGLIRPPVNTTVYVGQTAVFYSETLSQCSMRAYINNCRVQDDRHHSSTINNITYSNCIISNVQISDDGTRIDMYIYSHGGINCYNPVFLTVIGLPPSPHNLTKELYCDNIIITGPWSENTTSIYIRIIQGNNIVFSKNESTFPINISESIFEDHHKYYKILVYNKNPTGLSQEYFEMDLRFKDKIYFNVSSSSLEIMDNNVVLNITVQVNTSCPLSVPQQFNLSSNCLINSFYQVINGTVINKTGLIDLSVDLQLNKLNCTVTMNSGNHKVYVTKNTYEVQEVIISENTSTGYFNVNCTFLLGSLVKGCAIEVFNQTGEYIFSQNISRLSSTSSYAIDNSSTCLTNNGTYTIYVYIWDRHGRVNKSLQVAHRPLTVIQGCKDQDSFSKNVTMVTTPKPTISKNTALSSTQSWYYIVGSVGGVIILIVILILCFCVLYYKNKKNLIMADNEVMYNVKEEMVIMTQGAKSSEIFIVSGKTPSTNNTGDNSNAISSVTSDYCESTTLLHDEQRVVYQDLQKFSKHRPQNEMVTLKSPKTSKISDTNKHTSNDEEITERPTSPSLVNISEAKSILELENNDAQFPFSSGELTAYDTELDYQSIFVEEGSNNDQSYSEVVPIAVTPVSIKKDHKENVSENIVGSEMVVLQSQPHTPIKAKDTGRQSKLQIPPNPKWNPSSEMRQNNTVMTIPNKSTTVTDPPDKTNQSVSDEKYPSII